MENNDYTQPTYDTNYDAPAGDNTPVGNDKLYAILAYICPLWLIGLFAEPEKNHAFVKNHVNNGILLSIGGIIASIIPFLGWFVVSIVVFVFWIMALVKAIQGEMFDLPIVGDKIKIVKY